MNPSFALSRREALDLDVKSAAMSILLKTRGLLGEDRTVVVGRSANVEALRGHSQTPAVQ